MPTSQPSKPSTPAPKPAPQPQPSPKPEPKPEGGKTAAQATTIGMKPDDPKDPQAVKFEPHSAPPRWDEPKEAKPAPADGLSAPDEQRARAAEVEEQGLADYIDEIDERDDEDKPKFDKAALAGGGAFVHPGAQKQVPGVAPPAKRS